MALQNVIEQCCNYFLRHERFPATYEELQPLPLLTSGLLLPPPGFHARPQRAGKICYYPGWLKTAYLQSSHPQPIFLRLCG